MSRKKTGQTKQGKIKFHAKVCESSMLAAPFSAMVSTVQQHACLGRIAQKSLFFFFFLWGFEDACDLKRYDTNIDTYTPPPLYRP